MEGVQWLCRIQRQENVVNVVPMSILMGLPPEKAKKNPAVEGCFQDLAYPHIPA